MAGFLKLNIEKLRNMCIFKQETFDEHENRLEKLQEQDDINQKLIKRNNLNPLFQGFFETTFPCVMQNETTFPNIQP